MSIAATGATLALDGTWSNVAGSTITASGGTLDLGNSSNAWSNAGSITATDSTVNLGGDFTVAGLGSFTRSGGMVNLTGALGNTGATLAFTASTGSWIFLGGSITGGTVTEAGGGELTFTSSGGTLSGVTFDDDLDLASINVANATVTGGLTLDNATVFVGNAAGSTYGQLFFNATETLGGTGTVLFGKNGSDEVYEETAGLRHPGRSRPGITVRGSSGALGGYYGSDAVINQPGAIDADDSGGLATLALRLRHRLQRRFGTGSTAAPIDTSGVTDPAPEAVYQTYRSGYSFSYTLTGLTPSASYTLRLHFADPSSTAAGQREFDVSVNGAQVLTDFDIYATAGARRDQAVVESLPATADAQGDLTIGFTYGSGAYPLVNGIEVDSGGTIVQAIDCGELAGGTVTVNAGTFTNQGSLEVQNGESLNITGLTGNLGAVPIVGAGTSLSVSGTNYVVNQNLTAASGQSLTLGGAWSDTSGVAIAATDATLTLGMVPPGATRRARRSQAIERRRSTWATRAMPGPMPGPSPPPTAPPSTSAVASPWPPWARSRDRAGR